MAGCANGAELVQKLKGTGSPEGALAGPRKVLADVHRIEGRIASANEVMVAMETGEYTAGDQRLEIPVAQPGTLQKVRALVKTGEWSGPPQEVVVPVEERLLGATATEVDLDASSPVSEPEPLLVPAPAPAAAPADAVLDAKLPDVGLKAVCLLYTSDAADE